MLYLSGDIHPCLQAKKGGGHGRLQCAGEACLRCSHSPTVGSKSEARLWTALWGGALPGVAIFFPCSCGVSDC